MSHRLRIPSQLNIVTSLRTLSLSKCTIVLSGVDWPELSDPYGQPQSVTVIAINRANSDASF
jgi:hypothetical protein